MINATHEPGTAAVLGLSDDPQTIHLVKVSSASGERVIISVPIEQMEWLQKVLARGAGMLDGCSPQVVSLVDRLQYGNELDKLVFRPRGEAA